MIVADIFLILIFTTLLVFGFLGFLAWQKVSTFLTWNTRYSGVEYEQAVRDMKTRKPSVPASRNAVKGRAVKPVEDLVDLGDMPFEQGFEAIAEIGQVNNGR